MASSATKVMCLLIIMGLAVPSLATDCYVGDALGWTPAANLLQWLIGKTFYVNDVLHFISLPPLPVYLVTATAYASCDVSAPLFTDLTGNCVYKLTKAETLYFISDVVNCKLGLKIAIKVILA